MRFSQNMMWQTVAGMAALLPMLASALPLTSVKRQDESYHECMNPDGKRFYMYNKAGEPSPDDLQVATNHDGKPYDLSTLAVMRAMVELDPAHIEKIVHIQENKTGNNLEWVSIDYTCGQTNDGKIDGNVGEERWVANGLSFEGPTTITDSPVFKASNLLGTYDNAEGSIWPLIIQEGVSIQRDVVNPGHYPNMVNGPEPGTMVYTHETTHNPMLHIIAQFLWQGAYNTEIASTDKASEQADALAWVQDVMAKTHQQKTPCLLATNGDVQGKGWAGETVYTVAFDHDGTILARDVRKPYSDEPLKTTSEDIAKNVAYITYFDKVAE